jgi:VWFA-related protein
MLGCRWAFEGATGPEPNIPPNEPSRVDFIEQDMPIRGDFRLFILCCFALVMWSRLMAQQPEERHPQDSTYTLKTDVDVVLVPVVVRDKQGRTVGNLKRENFQISDNDKPQAITGFMIQKREGIESDARTAPAPVVPGATPPPTIVPNRFIVFLFDDMHLSIGDLAQAQKASTKMLAGSLADTDMAAIVSMSGKINSGLTTNRAQLQAAIMKMQPQSLYRMTGSECPNIDYYHADLIENRHNSAALEAAIDEVMSCSPGIDLRDVARRLAETAAMQSLAMGEQDVRVTLASVREIVRKMAALPGQTVLILVSPGFLLTPETRAEESQVMNLAVQSNVIISALDARGLYTSEIDASEMIKGSAQTSQLKSEYRRNTMSLDEDVMAELAHGTGGTYFHNSNDIEGGFKQLTEAPEYLYLLEFSIRDVRQNGSYHRLKVKTDQKGLTLQSRGGYFAPNPPKKKK